MIRQLFHVAIVVVQWVAVVLSVIFFASTSILIAKCDKTKKWPAHWYRYFCKTILFVTRVKVIVVGKERIDRDKNYLVCSNHQGLLDILSIVAALPLPLLFVSKSDYFKIPLLGHGMRACDHLEVTRTNAKHDQKVMELLVRYLEEGRNYVMYPEGTRTRDGSISPFKMGAFHAATASQVPVLPVTMIGSRERMPRDAKSVVPGNVRVIVGEPIESAFLSPEELCDKVREVIVSQYERYSVPLE